MFYLFKCSWKYGEEDRWKIILFSIFHGISFIGLLMKPYALGQSMNVLQLKGNKGFFDMSIWLLMYFLCFVFFEVFHRLAQYFVVTTGLKNQKRFINIMYKKLYTLPIKWHNNNHSGETVNRINMASQALRDFTFEQRKYLEYFILSIGPVILLLRISWKVALISVSLSIINLIIVEKLNRLLEPIMYDIKESFHKLISKLIDFTTNIYTIKSLKLGYKSLVEINKKFDYYYIKQMNEHNLNQIRCFILSFFIIITELLIIIYYLWEHKNSDNTIMIGTLLMLISYYQQMSNSFSQILSMFYSTLDWKTSLFSTKCIEDAYIKNEKIYTPKNIESLNKHVINTCENIFIKNLSYNYDENKIGVRNINFEISKKLKIAIVGKSGSGKSTLLKILSGFYIPDKVKVSNNKKSIEFSNLTESTLLIPQDTEIFENTIYNNITFGINNGISTLSKSIKISCLNNLIKKLPKGLKTDIREKGVNLSGGEKQRISIARGLYFSNNKKILLFDEITSSIDSKIERQIFEQILKHFNDRCIIASLHSLHLSELFDKILVLDNGCIVQEGTFQKLVNTDGIFKNLWQNYLSSK